MAKYYQRPDGLYETSRKINGKRVVFRARTCREVDQKILAYQEDRTSGRPFPVVADEWLAMREPDIARATYLLYRNSVERIKAEFPQRVGKITPLDLSRYIRRFERRGFAGGTVGIEITVIKQIFRYAVQESGDCEVSPAAELRKSRDLPRTERHALTPEQEQKVIAFRGENWLLGVMLLYTGCRRGELLALNWSDVDRRAGVIHVNKKLSWAGRNQPVLENDLKNHKPHDVPLFDALQRVLPTNRVGAIFTNEDGKYLSASELSRIWKNYARDVGLDGVTPHCFRHSFATICFEAGVDIASAASFLGDTEAVVANVYTELRKEKRDEAAALLNEHLNRRAATV